MKALIEQLLKKMGMYQEPNVLEKTTELIRLLELRSTNVSLQINEYGKIVLCADLAAAALGIAFDKENALKLSGLKKSHYSKNKRIFEKLLDLTKIVGVHDICVQLVLNELTQKADKLLELYKILVATENHEVDMTHPQYAAMAVYQACKLNKKKITKTKIMAYSNLRPSQWAQLEHRWDKFIIKHYKEEVNKNLKIEILSTENLLSEKIGREIENKLSSKGVKRDVENYEEWKHRMLEMATNKLTCKNINYKT